MPVTVPFSELSGSPEVSYTEAKFSATRRLLCDWDQALTLMLELSGTVMLDAAGEPVYINPEAFPGIPAAVVRSCSFAPYQGEQQGATAAGGTDTTRATYRTALVTVNYDTPDFNPGEAGSPNDPDAFITETLTPSVSFLSMSPVDAFWDNAQTQRLDYQTPLAIPVGQMEYVYQRRRFPDPIPSQMFSFVGHCNSATVTSTRLNYTFPAETLLYVGSEFSRETILLNDGTQSIKAWDIKQRYKYRSFSWNKFYKKGTSTPQNIYDSAGAVIRPVPTADFTLIRG